MAGKEEISAPVEQKPDQLSEEELARKVQAGDRQAFARLVESQVRRYYRIAFRILGDRNEAEEMVQSAFLKFWRQPLQWDPERGVKFSTWFYRVVVNLCLDVKRKQKRIFLPENLPEVQADPTTEEALIREERRQIFARLLEELPERQRTALQLCFYEGLSNQEAAEVMGLGLKALQSLLMRAKDKLRAGVLKVQGGSTV